MEVGIWGTGVEKVKSAKQSYGEIKIWKSIG